MVVRLGFPWKKNSISVSFDRVSRYDSWYEKEDDSWKRNLLFPRGSSACAVRQSGISTSAVCILIISRIPSVREFSALLEISPPLICGSFNFMLGNLALEA